MADNKNFDVIIIGGSYSGLAAAMALGRALRQVLIVDSGEPCNKQTPHSHNFITQDGKTPGQIADTAKQQVLSYPTVKLYERVAVSGRKTNTGFEIETQSGNMFKAKKLILATGIRDIMPDVPGFAECWGISVIHCPFCHGYEYRNTPTGIMANGDMGFHLAQMVANWTDELTLFTNGRSTLTPEQVEKLQQHRIEIVETTIQSIEHQNGKIQNLFLKDGGKFAVKAVYARLEFVQHTGIPAALGCELDEQGLLKVDEWRKTSVAGVFACGDNSSVRSVAAAVYTGSMAGAAASKELIEEAF